jgi:hypothetical protein
MNGAVIGGDADYSEALRKDVQFACGLPTHCLRRKTQIR